MATLADINDTLMQSNAIAARSDAKIDALAQMWADYTFDYRRRANASERAAREAAREASSGQQKSGMGFVSSSGDGGGGGQNFGGLLNGFSLGALGVGAAGLLGALGTFLKKGLFAVLGITLADELGEYIAGLSGSEVLGNMTEWAAIGGAFGFLFGPKYGIYGAIAGALFSDSTRQLIVDGINSALGTEIEKNDWAAWGLAAGGLLGLQFGPRLLVGALGQVMGIGSNIEVDKNGNLKDKGSNKYISKTFGNRFRAGFRKNAAIAAGVGAVGLALSSVIGDTLGAEAGGIAQDVTATAAFASMFIGTGAALPLAIAGLAVIGGSAIIKYLRGKNEDIINEAIANADAAMEGGVEDANGQILLDKAGIQAVDVAANELRRKSQMTQLSPTEASQLSEYEQAAAVSRQAYGADIGSTGRTALARGALASGEDQFFDLALARMEQDNIGFRDALLRSIGDATKGDLVSNQRATEIAMLDEVKLGEALAEALERRDLYKSNVGGAPTIVNAPQTSNVSTSQPIMFSNNKPSSPHRRFTSD